MNARVWVSAGVLLAGLLLVAAPGNCRELKGVALAETWEQGGATLTLQGAGVRRKFFIAVYVGALYLGSPTQDAERARRADEPKAVIMQFLRDVGADKVREGFQEGLFNNAQEQLPQLQGRIDQLLALFQQELTEGTRVEFVYLPGQGTQVRVQGRQETLPGTEFMQALWGVWLGEVPADHGLKKQLLGID